jgi:hypothetical protein
LYQSLLLISLYWLVNRRLIKLNEAERKPNIAIFPRASSPDSAFVLICQKRWLVIKDFLEFVAGYGHGDTTGDG